MLIDQPHQIAVQSLITTVGQIGRCDIAVDGNLSEIKLHSDFANPNGDTSFDVKLDGVTIYASVPARPKILVSTNAILQTGLTVAVIKGQVLTVETTIIQTGGIGNYLIFQALVKETLADPTSVSGNAGTATALQTARTIDGVSFNGTANITVIAPATHAATSKATPVDADELPLADSVASFVLKRLTWANLKATLKTYLDTLYQVLNANLTTIAGLTATTDSFMQAKASAWASRTIAQVLVDLQGTGLLADYAGFRNIPQNSQSAAYTCVAADSGKCIFHPAADTTARTWTIPANASVAYPIGTCIQFINQNGGGVITIAITTDTMRLAGAGTTGSRTLAANGTAVAEKVTATEWIISGTGLT